MIRCRDVPRPVQPLVLKHTKQFTQAVFNSLGKSHQQRKHSGIRTQ